MIRDCAGTRGRLPRKSDFSEREVLYIKAYFGPWPRALEAAGVKQPREFDRIERNREKRARAKERRNRAVQTPHTDGDRTAGCAADRQSPSEP